MDLQNKSSEIPIEEKCQGRDDDPILFQCILKGQLKYFEHLLFDSRQNLKLKNYYGQTLLHVLARYKGGYAVNLAKLVDNNVIPRNALSLTGRTPLHSAASSGSCVSLGILCHGVNKTERLAMLDMQDYTSGNTPLHDAIISKKYSAAILLAEFGADIGIRNYNDEKPIDLAKGKCIENFLKIVSNLDKCEDCYQLDDQTKLLSSVEFEAAMSCRNNNRTLPQRAIVDNKWDIFKYMQSKLYNQDNLFKFPELELLDNEYKELLHDLEEHISRLGKLNSNLNDNNYTNCLILSRNLIKRVNLVTGRKMNIVHVNNYENYNGEMLSDYFSKTIEDLLDLLDSLDLISGSIKLPIFSIKYKNVILDHFSYLHKKMIATLVANVIINEKVTDICELNDNYKKYFNCSTRNKENLLHLSCKNNRTFASQVLLNNLKDQDKLRLINKKSEYNGYTPLHYAAENLNEDLVLLLLADGANYCVLNNEKLTAYSIIKKKYHKKSNVNILKILDMIWFYFKEVEKQKKSKFCSSTKWYKELTNMMNERSKEKNALKFLALTHAKNAFGKSLIYTINCKFRENNLTSIQKCVAGARSELSEAFEIKVSSHLSNI